MFFQKFVVKIGYFKNNLKVFSYFIYQFKKK